MDGSSAMVLNILEPSLKTTRKIMQSLGSIKALNFTPPRRPRFGHILQKVEVVPDSNSELLVSKFMNHQGVSTNHQK